MTIRSLARRTLSIPAAEPPANMAEFGAVVFGRKTVVDADDHRWDDDAELAAGGAPPARLLTLRIERQIVSNWCWAAVAASVARYFDAGTQWTRCAVASARKGGNCCASPHGLQCDQQDFLDQVLQRVGHLRPGGFTQTLDANVVDGELAQNFPVCIRVGWEYGRGGGHFLAIVGIRPGQGGRAVLTLSDPITGTDDIEHDLLLRGGYQGSNRGQWTHSYLVQP